MQTIVSAREMRWCDAATIGKYGVPGVLLMENAGRGVFEWAERTVGRLDGKNVLVFCGKGNNGGDGFVIARHLLGTGAVVTVVLLAGPRTFAGDALTNFRILRKLRLAYSETLRIQPYAKSAITRLENPDLIIDAIFGTGFSGEVPKPIAECIRWINNQTCPVISVDIPSGVNGTTGCAHASVKATRTVTFGLLKTGLLCNQGPDQAGKIELVDIGIPARVSRSSTLRTFLVDPSDVKRRLPRRSSTAHKYSVGKVLVLAGSKGYTGAAYLCALAALRAGAGAVNLATPETVYSVLARRLAEAIVTPLPSTAEGTLSGAARTLVEEKLKWCDVAVIGPGLSVNAETQELLRKLLSQFGGKVVVDADALRVVADVGLKAIRRTRAQWVLTPHAGEFSRITGDSSAGIEENRIEMARNGAVASGAVIVLKGGPTATGLPDGKVVLNSSGNPGMATVGSGDVLAGIIASLWAQGMDRDAAAYSGVYVHGLAGDCAKAIHGERSVIASDLIDQLPAALRRVEGI